MRHNKRIEHGHNWKLCPRCQRKLLLERFYQSKVGLFKRCYYCIECYSEIAKEKKRAKKNNSILPLDKYHNICYNISDSKKHRRKN